MMQFVKILVILIVLTVNSLAHKSIYIWSKSFESNSNNEILSTLKNNNIDIAIISFHKSQTDKFKDILNKDIKIIPLISDNNLIYPKNRNKLDEKIKFLSQFSNEIHLDIEPHALPELKHNRELYFKLYIQMLKYLKEKYPNIKIDISIPTFYYKIPNLDKYANNLYIMAYENPKSLIKRISRFDKSSFIAQNCKEFHSKNELKEIFDIINQNGYKNIAYHSYKTCKRFLDDK